MQGHVLGLAKAQREVAGRIVQQSEQQQRQEGFVEVLAAEGQLVPDDVVPCKPRATVRAALNNQKFMDLICSADYAQCIAFEGLLPIAHDGQCLCEAAHNGPELLTDFMTYLHVGQVY